MPAEKMSPRNRTLWVLQPAASSAAEFHAFGTSFSLLMTRIFKILARFHQETNIEALGKV